MEKTEKRKRAWLRVILNLLIVLAIIGLVYLRSLIAGKEYFFISYAPFSSTVRIGDKYYKNNSYNYIEPGEYDLIVEHEHFATVIDHITIPNEFNSAYGALESIDDEGDRIAAEATKDYQQVGKGLASESSPKLEYKIEQYLPIQNSLYKIAGNFTPESEDSDKLLYSINIEAGDVYIDSAVKKLFSFIDKDPALSAYDIRLLNYENPFAERDFVSFTDDPIEYVKNTYDTTIEEGDYIFTDTIKSGRYVGVVMCSNKNTGSSTIYKTSRVIMKRDGDNWAILSEPYPILTKTSLPDLPTTFLNRVNLVNCGA